MASIIRTAAIDAPPDVVWAALRDFGALHVRLAPGFVTDTRLEDEGTRVVTFASGAVAREVLVGRDDAARRLSYSVVESPLGATHHNASAQVFADGAGGSHFVWTTDVLPDEVAGPIAGLMEQGLGAVQRTLSVPARPPAG
jgi:carbon monoxide dehydrogenase subunit G